MRVPNTDNHLESMDRSDNVSQSQIKKKMQKGIAHKHLHSRVSYLYQAATYLAKAADQLRARTPCPIDDLKKQSGAVGELQCAESTLEAASDEGLPIPPITEGSKMSEIDPDIDGLSKDFALSRQLIKHLRGVSLKGQVRLSPTVKHAMCRRCDIILVPGSTSTSYMENKSRGGRKPWADVLVTTCTACGTSKRFPVGAKRQLKRKSKIGKAPDMGKQGHPAVHYEHSD